MRKFNLEEQFNLKRHKEKAVSDVEDIKLFFNERHISNRKIADVLEVQPQQVGHWFNGRQSTPVKRKAELGILIQMVLDWEKGHGRIFNSVPKCPYDDGMNDIKLGRDFDIYMECEDCKMRSECGKVYLSTLCKVV